MANRPLEVDRLVVQHLPAALRLAKRLTSDPNTAEDLVQEALCRVLDRWKSFPRRGCLQHLDDANRGECGPRPQATSAKTQELPPEIDDSTAVQPDEHAAAAELNEILRAAIDNLPTANAR